MELFFELIPSIDFMGAHTPPISCNPLKHILQGGNELLICQRIESQEILTPFQNLE